MKNIWAVIPARSGSKGIKNKNIRKIEGEPLLNYSIKAALNSDFISRIILDTDSIEYQDIGKKAGAEIPFLRPKEISQDKSTDHDVFRHLLDFFGQNSPDLWVHLRPTTPIRDKEIIDKAISEFLDDNLSSSLRSVHPCSESPYKWFLKDSDNYAKTICDEISLNDLNQPRQTLPKVYVPNGYIDLIRTSQISLESLHGEKIKLFETPYSPEVDTIEDFEFISYLINKKRRNCELKK